jgi:hypothetical protein
MNFKKISLGIPLIFFSLGIFFVFGIFSSVEAAYLSVSPASGSYSVGDSFSVSVLVSSSDQAVNAVSGSLIFPADKLQVVSISKTGSVVNFWVQEPAYSNSAGTLDFEGVILNPGFTGVGGLF